jgi:prolyl 4-hydroxylase
MLHPLLQKLEAQAREGDLRAQVSLGLALEIAGRERDGMNWLALAARSGDVEAMGLVGARLAAGRFGAELAPRGIGLLENASYGGNAEAARRLAVFQAAGVHVPQSWGGALDLLLRAAELGSQEALTELIILARAEESEGASKRGRAGLRKQIDLAAWTRPPDSDVICADPLIRTFPKLAPAAACRWIVTCAKPLLVEAEIYDPDGGTTTSSKRTNRHARFDLQTSNIVVLLIQQAVAQTVGMDLAMCEAGSVLCYRPGEEAGEHYDFLDPAVPAYAQDIQAGGQRIATGLVYLNDDYEHGATEFPRLGLSHTGLQGSALVFTNLEPSGEPDLRTEHAGRPPAGGSKWVLSCFVRNRRRLG